MFTSEFVRSTHEELQNLLPGTRVLLGGSYLHSEATDDSDLDFFVIAPIWNLLRLRQALKKYRIDGKNRRIHILLVPRSLSWLGVYSLYGRDVRGKIYKGYADQRTMIATSLRLAYYFYLLAREKNDEQLFKKARQQAAITKLCVVGVWPPFTKQAIATQFEAGSNSLVDFPQVLAEIDRVAQPFLAFNWRVWLLYNIMYIHRNDWLFLFKNPDTLVRSALQKSVTEPETWSLVKDWVVRYVFPVIMY